MDFVKRQFVCQGMSMGASYISLRFVALAKYQDVQVFTYLKFSLILGSLSKELIMRKSMLMVSVLVAALSSGVVMAKGGGAGGGSGGSGQNMGA